MSAIQKIGILAGSGDIPAHVAASFDGEVFVVGFEEGADPAFVEQYDHIWTRIGQTEAVLKALRARGVSDLVLIGGMKRPKWSEIKPDLKTLGFLAKNAVAVLGDNGLLVALKRFLEGEGFRLYGAHVIVPDLLMPSGCLTRRKPDERELDDIKIGFEGSQLLGRDDIGQAVIVKNGEAIAEEDVYGTDALMFYCAETEDAILIKTCKPQQDMDLDLPTAGLKTIENACDAKMAGIVLHAGKSLLLDREAVIQYADAHNMFVMGVEG